MHISVEEMTNHIFLHIGENISFECAADFKAALEGAFDNSVKSLVVDLGEVNYICSSALGTLIFLFRQVGTAGGGVYVITPHTKLRRVFDLVHIPRLVTFVNDKEAALELIEQGS